MYTLFSLAIPPLMDLSLVLFLISIVKTPEINMAVQVSVVLY